MESTQSLFLGLSGMRNANKMVNIINPLYSILPSIHYYINANIVILPQLTYYINIHTYILTDIPPET